MRKELTSPPREKALGEWWAMVNKNPMWSREIAGVPYDKLTQDQQDAIWEIFVTDVNFLDT